MYSFGFCWVEKPYRTRTIWTYGVVTVMFKGNIRANQLMTFHDLLGLRISHKVWIDSTATWSGLPFYGGLYIVDWYNSSRSQENDLPLLTVWTKIISLWSNTHWSDQSWKIPHLEISSWPRRQTCQKTQEAPFLPKVKSKKDLANFSVHPDEMPRFIEYVDDGSGPLTS